MLGTVSDADKAALLRSVDAYVAPHLGGESFGIVLVEAMAAGAPVVASDLPAFAAVLDEGRTGVLFETGSHRRRSRGPCSTCSPTATGGAALRTAGLARARVFDWGVVADRIMAVYETVIAGADGEPAEPTPHGLWGRLVRGVPGWGQLMVDVLQLATFLVILVIGIAWYLSYSAARLDRLHAKVEGAMSALDAALVRRAEAALELANSGVLDPASALLIADAATESIERTTEQPVTDDLLDGQHFGGPRAGRERPQRGAAGGADRRGRRRSARAATRTSWRSRSTRVASSGLRVQLARRFHNDATREVRRVRAKRSVRAVPAVRATPSLPEPVSFDDDAAPALGRLSAVRRADRDRWFARALRRPTLCGMSEQQNAQGTGTTRVKRGMAEMLKGGVIMDVVNAEQAKIAEDAGAVAVMALERVPADIRAQGGVSRMSDPDMIDEHHRGRVRSRSWPRPGSATSSRRRCCRASASTTSTSPRC